MVYTSLCNWVVKRRYSYVCVCLLDGVVGGLLWGVACLCDCVCMSGGRRLCVCGEGGVWG